jgi:signal transduction histidine kinase
VGRRIPIRVKVAAALAVPLLALVVGAAVGVSTSTSQARTITRQAELATASIGHAGLINVLQNERNTALVQMLGLGALVELEEPDVEASRQRTDQARDGLQRHVSGQSDRLREDWANALSTLDDLSGLRQAVDAAVANPGPANREAAHEVFADYTDMVSTIRDQVADVLERRADDLRSQAEARRRWYVGAALAAVIAAVLVAWRVSRSITRPLGALSHDARSMAEEQLPGAVAEILDAPRGQDIVPPEPPPITVTTSDEVSDVAHALDDVQRSALGLAVEQATLRRTIAESYVNLGRRNQNLLSRLLDAIGDLEHGETDPERIAQLHKVDHLATRMRRNAESLLVLSQADLGPTWHPPVRVLDVVRAALGEIENYQRVVVRTLDPVMIVGGVASDLTHLLAELIENGVKHSPPHELVEIRGRTTPGGYSLAVIDHGLGMSAADIAQANQRLAGAEPPTIALSKHLGHFVAAALAARNGISVRLQGSEVVGIAAIVDLPAAVAAATPPDPVRELVAPSAPPPPTQPAVPPPLLAQPDPDAAVPPGPVVPAASPVSVPAPAAIPVGGGTPAVTASGLARRVRGAQHPGASGPLVSTGRSPSIRPAATLDDHQPGVDPAEIQRFLTSLAAGVQRSLGDTGSERDRESQ